MLKYFCYSSIVLGLGVLIGAIIATAKVYHESAPGWLGLVAVIGLALAWWSFAYLVESKHDKRAASDAG